MLRNRCLKLYAYLLVVVGGVVVVVVVVVAATIVSRGKILLAVIVPLKRNAPEPEAEDLCPTYNTHAGVAPPQSDRGAGSTYEEEHISIPEYQ